MLRMNWLGTSEPSSHPGIGTANPPSGSPKRKVFMLPVAESSSGNRQHSMGYEYQLSTFNLFRASFDAVLSRQSYLPLPTAPFHTSGSQT